MRPLSTAKKFIYTIIPLMYVASTPDIILRLTSIDKAHIVVTMPSMIRKFVENTSVNDEFLALNEQLNQDISDKVRHEINMQCAASMSYMATMTVLTFSIVENNLGTPYTGSYSSDCLSDYMFDQNDYTLSDGSSVKVSTSYNYVLEGSNGTVYYGNSLSDAPDGATQLYANH